MCVSHTLARCGSLRCCGSRAAALAAPTRDGAILRQYEMRGSRGRKRFERQVALFKLCAKALRVCCTRRGAETPPFRPVPSNATCTFLRITDLWRGATRYGKPNAAPTSGAQPKDVFVCQTHASAFWATTVLWFMRCCACRAHSRRRHFEQIWGVWFSLKEAF